MNVLDMTYDFGKKTSSSFNSDHDKYSVWDSLRKQSEGHDRS